MNKICYTGKLLEAFSRLIDGANIVAALSEELLKLKKRVSVADPSERIDVTIQVLNGLYIKFRGEVIITNSKTRNESIISSTFISFRDA